MKKRTLSLLLCLVMCLTLMPMSAFAADIAYDVWVNGEQFTSDNLSITCGSGTAVYDPAKGELTLNNATITNVHSDDSINAAVYSGEALTVVLKDSNTVSPASSEGACGFYTDSGDLTLTGSGDVDIKSYYEGIYANAGNITLSNSGSVNIHSECYECIYASEGDVVISGAGGVTIKAEDDDGIYAYNKVTVSGDGDLTVTSHYYGINAYYGDVVISGAGDVTIEAEDDDGINAYEKVTVSGDGDLTVTSNENGINAYYGDITISGDGNRTFYITSDNDYSAVLAEYGDIDVSGTGKLTIASAPGSSSEYYVGLYSQSGSLSVSGSVVLNISDTEYGTFSEKATTFASGGEMTVDKSVVGVSSNDNIIFSGIGKATINGGEYGACLYASGKSVLLNGTGTPISLTGIVSAVYNGGSENSLVAGTKFDDYDMTGAPDGQSVVYTLKCSHTPVTITGKVATCTEDGWKDYYECSLCHKYFEDNACEAEIADLDVWKAAGGNGYIPKLEPTPEPEPEPDPINYKIIEGAQSTWSLDDVDVSPLFRSDADFSKFVRVELDGKVLDPANYTAKPGSTIIELKPAFAAKLAPGKHTIEIVSTDGSASTVFYIEETIANTDGEGFALSTAEMSSAFIGCNIVGLAVVFFELKKKKKVR